LIPCSYFIKELNFSTSTTIGLPATLLLIFDETTFYLGYREERRDGEVITNSPASS
jgi:hypothetical protein